MTEHDISNAEDPDLRNSLQALRRAAELARQTAIQTNTDLIIFQDGKTVRIPAAVPREQQQSRTAPTS